jgi:16S rRNA (guanine966-N2)-methyltransferase
MRVIAGTRRSLPLKSLEGDTTRPTADRYKETLFNVLQTDIPGCRFLDLFAGSGAIGIEALSRGARHAVFVENNRKAMAVIKENIHFTKFEDESDLILSDAVSYIRSLPVVDFDIIFIDPPYNHDLEVAVLEALEGKKFKNPEARIVVEAALEQDFSFLEGTSFRIEKVKAYKSNKHLFIRREEA